MLNKTKEKSCRKISVTGAGCLRADRYGTLEVDGRPLIPLLSDQLARQGVGQDVPFAGRVTVVVELWARPLRARSRGGDR